MFQMLEFMCGPLKKPSPELQEKAAFKSLSVTYDPEAHDRTLQSVVTEILSNIRSEVCMLIVNVVPNVESKEIYMCEMWMVKGPRHDPVPIWGHPDE
jgi:hypothetical protein